MNVTSFDPKLDPLMPEHRLPETDLEKKYLKKFWKI